ncbi:hypothetical protein GCM10023168_27510 [Fodinibacter luteus]|uniref:Lysyl-tRNA synthetase n=1 Tax=Fodinibacter luteus TaxID=552064 RepID=A0ABP8KLT2_9MICO
MSDVWPYVAAIVPTIVVATLFYFLIKGMMEGDRRERLAQSRFEAAQDRERARSEDAAADSAGREAATPERGNAEDESGKTSGE